MTRERGGPFRIEEAEKRSPMPLRATGIVLTAWVGALVFIAFVVVPLIFATCFPTNAPPA
ncbi:MAG TPA: hypothetical protein VFW12_05535 [Candidatus Limnocylindria bacterium]|nr:hypothetical protein [Candidatus Limnocylindria bacterium]